MKRSEILEYSPLLLVAIVSVAIKSYDPLRSPVLAALDPWGWTIQARQFLLTQKLDSLFTETGYPPTFMYLIAGAAAVFRSDPYDVVRYLPIISALNVIPIYLLSFEVFRSHRISALASLLAITSRFYFMRTSIGIPEGLAHFFFTFALLFLLKSFSGTSWKYRLLGIASIATSVLYYHFTVLILIPFLVVLPLGFWSQRKAVVREIAIITVPAFLLTGIIWYFQVLPSMVHYYLGVRTATYAKPAFENSFGGLAHVLVYSVAKSSVVALSEIGYVITLLAFVGIAYLLTKQSKKQAGTGLSFLLTYLAVLVGLTLLSRIIYNLGVAGAGDSSVYLFSWLTIPASILAADAVQVGVNHIGGILHTRFKLKDLSRIMKVMAICTIILLALLNLSSFNYYKAPTGGSPIPNSFYYYKPMTDQEYYALKYIREKTPSDAIILVVGVEHTILTEQAVVAGRTIIGIANMTIAGQTIEISGEVVFPDTRTANFSIGKIQRSDLSNQYIYVITGIKDVNIEVARTHGSPPADTVRNEQLLVAQLASSTSYQEFYHNDQITVIRVLFVQIQY